MKVRSLRTRFLLSGSLLLAITVACVVWSVITFARLGAAVDNTMGDTQETINLAVELINALEREDDALLLSLNGHGPRAAEELRTERRSFEEAYARLGQHVNTAAEKEVYATLRRDADSYRKLGDALLLVPDRPTALEAYHKAVNPALRQAVADCRQLRHLNLQAMEQA